MNIYKSTEQCIINPRTQLQRDHFANLVLSVLPHFSFLGGGWTEELEYFKVNDYVSFCLSILLTYF